MIVLFSTAFAAAPDPAAVRALAETDPHAATLASVGLTVEGLHFLCEGAGPTGWGPDGDEPWRWAIFWSDETVDDLARRLGPGARGEEAAEGRRSWPGSGDAAWFAGNDLAYADARVDVLAVDRPRAHLRCPDGAEPPSAARAILGVTAERHRGGWASRPAEPEPGPACEGLEIALDVPAGLPIVWAAEGESLLGAGFPAKRIDLATGVVEDLPPKFRFPDGQLPDGSLFVVHDAPTSFEVVDPVTFRGRGIPRPPWWNQDWSPLAAARAISLQDGVVVANGFDPPALWNGEAWVRRAVPERVLARSGQVLRDGRVLTWGQGQGVELVDLASGQVRTIAPAPGWASAVQLPDGDLLALIVQGDDRVLARVTTDGETLGVSEPVCKSHATLVALASGRVVLVDVVSFGDFRGDPGRTLVYWVAPPERQR